jgi:hypothetical protein
LFGPRTPLANMGHPSRGWGLVVKGDFVYTTYRPGGKLTYRNYCPSG